LSPRAAASPTLSTLFPPASPISSDKEAPVQRQGAPLSCLSAPKRRQLGTNWAQTLGPLPFGAAHWRAFGRPFASCPDASLFRVWGAKILPNTVQGLSLEMQTNSANCTLYAAHCSLYTVYCILYAVYCMLDSGHTALRSPKATRELGAGELGAHFALAEEHILATHSAGLRRRTCRPQDARHKRGKLGSSRGRQRSGDELALGS